MIAVGSKGLPHNIFYAKTTLGTTVRVVCCDGGRGLNVIVNTGKPADLLLYAVQVFENHPPTSSLPKQAVTDVSEQGLE
jgi:hypothetical protein